MRATIIVTSEGGLASAVLSKGTPHALQVGTKLVFTCPYETPYGVIPAGAKGFVETVDEDMGNVWVLMEGMEPALIYWDNSVVLSPYTTEDLLGCISLPVDNLLAAGHETVPIGGTP